MTMPDPALIAQFDQYLAKIEHDISEAVADIQEKMSLGISRDYLLGYIDSTISHEPLLMEIILPILFLKLAEATIHNDTESATG